MADLDFVCLAALWLAAVAAVIRHELKEWRDG